MEWVSGFNLLREKPVRDERRFLSTMEEVVSKFAGKITLSEAEQEEVIHVKTHDFEAFKTKLDLSLVGKVLTTKPFSRIDLKTKMVMAWNPTEDMKIREIDDNLFLFVFGNMEDKQRVLDNGPWHFDNALLVLDYTDGTVSPSEMKLNHADLWVQVHNLPLLGMNVVLGRRIANYLGKCLEVEEEGDGECWGKYMRLRVRLDVMQPLRRGMKICLEGCEPIWVDFKYEGIPEFCYHCGIWGHNESECEVVIGKERGVLFVTFSRMWEYVSPWVGLWSKEEEAIDFGSGNEELKERNSKLSHTEGLKRKGDQEDLTKGEDMERQEVIDESKECSPKLSNTEGQESNGDQEDLSNLTKGEDMEKPEVTEELKECSLKCSHTEGLGSNGDQQDLHRVGFKFGSIGLHEVCADSSTKSGFQFVPAKPEPLKETRVLGKVIRRNRKYVRKVSKN
ncbi:PREDICTED: uncharacterized protein LOC101304253 isoform X1 [Fragaria vesca subsp. vesca]|uniref:uncharacterized protein LOC101304253 isoform X1 n=2 Tax=Fragaria vesca subsp. vesca TaxID=101020 RepID=UPI0002C316EA|nr:PREDICTED: uncharacterized protein LOC101304253 isoform X1 [Fragaria vesca subsp. vesca]